MAAGIPVEPRVAAGRGIPAQPAHAARAVAAAAHRSRASACVDLSVRHHPVHTLRSSQRAPPRWGAVAAGRRSSRSSTAFKALLHHWTGADDILLGAAVAGRDRVELEPLIGCFVTMLPLRTHFSGNPPFTSLLARVRDTVFGALAHQSLPFHRLIDELRIRREPDRAPLVQVAFGLQHGVVPEGMSRAGDQAVPARSRDGPLRPHALAARHWPWSRGAVDLRGRPVRAAHHRASARRLRCAAAAGRRGADGDT